MTRLLCNGKKYGYCLVEIRHGGVVEPERIFNITRTREVAVTAVRIYQPAKTAMQSGRAKTHQWVLEFEPGTSRFTDPLMGWTGSSDTRSQLRLNFDSREQAIAYAERKGLDYAVQQPQVRRIRPKNYAENFTSRRM